MSSALPPPTCKANASSQAVKSAASLTLSYTPALNDGASGTVPLTHRRPVLSLLAADARVVAPAAPNIVSALIASGIRHRGTPCWAQIRCASLYVLVSALEVQVLLSAAVLWLALPGVALLPWLCLETALIWVLARALNREGHTFVHVADTTKGGFMSDQSVHWIVVGGMDVTQHQMRRTTLPRLAQLFGQDMQVFLPSRHGFPLDLVLVFFRRNLHIPTAQSTALAVRILAHNIGALDAAWVMSHLCADLPAGDSLRKLEVCTFGATTAEMTVPLGNHCDVSYPTVTHFAIEEDPFAQIGVFLGVRQRLEGRLAGGLFTIQDSPGAPTSRGILPQSRSYTLDGYLDVLFPDDDPLAGVLGHVCRIDREVSEMRAQSVGSRDRRTRRGSRGKRLSWTALGAVADSLSSGCGDHDEMAGAFSLSEVRRRDKALEGMKGYENNRLAEAVRARHQLRCCVEWDGAAVSHCQYLGC
ncbi:Uu.00g121110.m01.CDS01 [Anthostomella pinea]|uniref:Uu.00g121110.m01.CDS01 n=1 Tax=Anthostomella pinea TaxID=933095 RepID=A0AAI8VBP2_9PEZI|nr:Uu.00g121110.m01.CDS01 [Anthostomella pinea]